MHASMHARAYCVLRLARSWISSTCFGFSKLFQIFLDLCTGNSWLPEVGPSVGVLVTEEVVRAWNSELCGDTMVLCAHQYFAWAH